VVPSVRGASPSPARSRDTARSRSGHRRRPTPPASSRASAR
jgi:hypothetical protein